MSGTEIAYAAYVALQQYVTRAMETGSVSPLSSYAPATRCPVVTLYCYDKSGGKIGYAATIRAVVR
eukprot:3936564-Rhodomonas_salina.2